VYCPTGTWHKCGICYYPVEDLDRRNGLSLLLCIFDGKIKLTLDEFFRGNTAEDSIVPNDWGFGRPSIKEIWNLMRELEKMPSVAWIRVELHNDTEIVEHDGREVLVLAGESIMICTSLSASEADHPFQTDFVVLQSYGIDRMALSYITFSLSGRRKISPLSTSCSQLGTTNKYFAFEIVRIGF